MDSINSISTGRPGLCSIRYVRDWGECIFYNLSFNTYSKVIAKEQSVKTYVRSFNYMQKPIDDLSSMGFYNLGYIKIPTSF